MKMFRLLAAAAAIAISAPAMAATVTITGNFGGTLAGTPFGPQSAQFTGLTANATPTSFSGLGAGFDAYELTSLSATSPIGQNSFVFDGTGIYFYTNQQTGVFGIARDANNNLFSIQNSSLLFGTNTTNFTVNQGQVVNITAADNVSFSLASSAVPEPATWAMMLIGFGGIGASMRRRKQITTVKFA